MKRLKKIIAKILYYMGLANNAVSTKDGKINNSLDLTKDEIMYLMLLIKDSSFKGEDVEIVYNTVYKLQSKYKDLEK